MGGCTNCGQKGGCDTRKSGMFAAVDEALARLYPTRRWDERDETVALDAGVSREEGEALAAEIARRLKTVALFRPGADDEWCDYIYVLCLGRTPAIAEIREGGSEVTEDGGELGLEERYLRVVLSAVTPFAGVQEVSMTLSRRQGGADQRRTPGGPTGAPEGGGELVITESARSGVFDPVLLPRMQALVAILAERQIRHIDFGEIVEAPAGFDPGTYAERFGAEPVIANYLFYPQPPTTVSTVVLPPQSGGGSRSADGAGTGSAYGLLTPST